MIERVGSSSSNLLAITILYFGIVLVSCNSNDEQDVVDITGVWSKEACKSNELDVESWTFDQDVVYTQLYETLISSNTCEAWPSVNSSYAYDKENLIIDFVALDTTVASQTPISIRWLVDSLSSDYIRYFLINRINGQVDWNRRELFKE